MAAWITRGKVYITHLLSRNY